MTTFKPSVGDLWGGLAAMLVALPSAIAFGVTIYSPLGASAAAQGALAGVLGATALGLVAPALGGTQRLITAPCAPAAAVLAGFALEMSQGGGDPMQIALLLTLIGLGAGLLQLLFGTLGLGQLIKYMPYPVVSGYLSGVGLYILAGQVPKFLGAPKGTGFWAALAHPAAWQWQAITVGLATIAAMLLAPKLTRKVPAAIIALVAGMLTYFALGLFDPRLLHLAGNPLVIGALGGGAGLGEAIAGRAQAIGALDLHAVLQVAIPAATLAVLLSIDTLKTCVVLDALTRTRHQSNRELIGQGCGNVAAALAGGIPGAGTMGATLVNISSGAQTRFSGVIEGAMALLAFLLLGGLIAWVPVPALAAILMVIGARMIDRHSFALVRQASTRFDFFVIAAVVVTALTVSLIAASGVGVALVVVLFVRGQIRAQVVRGKAYGNQRFSKQIRADEDMKVLEAHGDQAVIFELQGSLFFGSTDQLYSALEPEIKARKYILLDMRRVHTVDVTAAHMLEQVRDMMAEKDGFLVYCHLPQSLPTGENMQTYFDQLGLAPYKSAARVFDELDGAQEWVENRILKEAALDHSSAPPLALADFGLFKGRKEATLKELETLVEARQVAAGERVFARGDGGDELFLIRAGVVRIVLPLASGGSRHVSSVGRGGFFGEIAFLDGAPRSADAIAHTPVELYVLSRARFDALADEHKKLALGVMAALASSLAERLRHSTREMEALAG